MPGVCPRLLLCLLAASVGGSACRTAGDLRVGGTDSRIEIANVSFEGVEQVSREALADALQTEESSWLPWGRKRFFDRRAFEADLKRIQAFYRDRGFPDARITSFDVSLNDAQDKADIIVRIAEGEPIRVADIQLEGFEVLPDGELERLRDTLPLQVDEPLDRQLALAARERAANALRDNGYPYAEVALAEEEIDPKRHSLIVRAVPGILARFGALEIVGETSVDETVIRRQLTFEPDDVFTRREIRASQQRLYRLELFEFVNVEAQTEVVRQLPHVPVRVTVAEGKHRKVTAGVGYGTEEQARARLRWDHVNFFGGGRHAGLEGKWSSLDRGVRAQYREPFFLRRSFSLNFDGQAWQAAEPVYSLDSFGGRATMRYQPNSQFFWSVSLINEYQRSTVAPEALSDFTVRDELIALGLDPRTGESTGTLSAAAFDISRNTTTNLLDARAGYVLNAHVEQAGRWLRGSFNYWSVTGEGRHYLTPAGAVVLANRLRLGTIDALGDLGSDIPFYKRYFLGGSSSLRGWGRFEVSPLSGFGLPIGGHTMLEGASEVRFPIWGRFAGVGFLDYGNVWPGSWDLHLNDLRAAVGPGLRYLTPIGPLRLDLGYQLNPIDNLRVDGEPQRRRWRLHFSVGQAF